LVNFLRKTITHYRWPADHFALRREYLFAHLWTFHTVVLQFLHSLYFVRKHRIIHDGFPQHSCF
jgi:hypothetical protein